MVESDRDFVGADFFTVETNRRNVGSDFLPVGSDFISVGFDIQAVGSDFFPVESNGKSVGFDFLTVEANGLSVESDLLTVSYNAAKVRTAAAMVDSAKWWIREACIAMNEEIVIRGSPPYRIDCSRAKLRFGSSPIMLSCSQIPLWEHNWMRN